MVSLGSLLTFPYEQNMDAQSHYFQIGHLIAEMPNLAVSGRLPAETQKWLGRAYALLDNKVSDLGDKASLKVAVDIIQRVELRRREASGQIEAILYRALAKAELEAPIAVQGAFIPAGNAFDALAAVAKVFGTATKALLVVDPYMDEKALTDFIVLTKAGIPVSLLADQHFVKPSLKPAVNRWVSQYGADRPMQARLSSPRALHDRLIVVDDTAAWILTQSFNGLAQRAPASIVRMDAETAQLKIAAHQAMWQASAPI
jgi:hypothetical protein